jgi:hypothetical protein
MPVMKLGTHSSSLGRVCRALEATAGIPQGAGGDGAWVCKMLAIINQKNRTDIRLVGEDYGYLFAYSAPAGAALLGRIKARYGL